MNRPIITCSNCGYRWTPNPNQWRRDHTPLDLGVLSCPRCHVPHRLTESELEQIIVIPDSKRKQIKVLGEKPILVKPKQKRKILKVLTIEP